MIKKHWRKDEKTWHTKIKISGGENDRMGEHHNFQNNGREFPQSIKDMNLKIKGAKKS